MVCENKRIGLVNAGLVTTAVSSIAAFNIKTGEVEIKIRDTVNLASKAALNTKTTRVNEQSRKKPRK